MTTRRTFLKSFLGAIVSVALAQRVVLDALKIAAKERQINPAWETAEYEYEPVEKYLA